MKFGLKNSRCLLLCLWDTKANKDHIKNIHHYKMFDKHYYLMDLNNVFLPLFHIKLRLTKHFVKALYKVNQVSNLRKMFFPIIVMPNQRKESLGVHK